MDITIKHHYLPEFFIEGFTDKKGIFWVYDKKENRILHHSQTKAMRFYEKKRNTITYKAEETDVIEKVYQKIEDLVKISIMNSRSEENLEKIENFETIGLLLVFIVYTYWRVPKNDSLNENLLNLYKNNKKDWDSFIKLDFLNEISENDRIKIAKTLIPTEILKEAAKFKSTGEMLNYKIVNFNAPVFLISDNPVIFSKLPVEFRDFQSPLIFPICKRRVLVFLENKNYTFDEESIKLINLLLIYQAERYIGFYDKEMLEKFVESYNHFKMIGKEHIDKNRNSFSKK